MANKNLIEIISIGHSALAYVFQYAGESLDSACPRPQQDRYLVIPSVQALSETCIPKMFADIHHSLSSIYGDKLQRSGADVAMAFVNPRAKSITAANLGSSRVSLNAYNPANTKFLCEVLTTDQVSHNPENERMMPTAGFGNLEKKISRNPIIRTFNLANSGFEEKAGNQTLLCMETAGLHIFDEASRRIGRLQESVDKDYGIEIKGTLTPGALFNFLKTDVEAERELEVEELSPRLSRQNMSFDEKMQLACKTIDMEQTGEFQKLRIAMGYALDNMTLIAERLNAPSAPGHVFLVSDGNGEFGAEIAQGVVDLFKEGLAHTHS